MIFIFIFLCTISHVLSLEFQDVTSEIFKDGLNKGLISAFGDFNSDKLTDFFIISPNGKSIIISLSNDSAPFFRNYTLECSFENIVTGLIPGDFNGDSMMDVLVTLRDSENENMYQSVVLWGNLESINCSPAISLRVSKQPFIIDYNDDMIPDIMAEDENGNRCVWLSNSTSNDTKEIIQSGSSHTLEKLRDPHSSSVVDLNYDMISDLMITGVSKIEIWYKEGFNSTNFIQFRGYPIDILEKGGIIGQSTFVDFNTDGKLDHILPVCYDKSCKKSAIMIWDDNETWTTLNKGFLYEKNVWGYFYPDKTILGKHTLPITLRAGDFNMDGYPDFIVVLENKTKTSETRAVIFENVPCSDCPFGRSLQIHWTISGLDSIKNVELATFYDIYDDGIIDILVVNKFKDEWCIKGLKNMETYDAYFIKVLVLSGLCVHNDCPSHKIPYGTNQPGPMVRFNTTKPNGDPLISCAVQISQTAHFPLHLPYSVFGLGQTPNFVDHLSVVIPEMFDNKKHEREWTQIIPNSQMVVIPYPPKNEHEWINKLFLTPSRLVLMTLIALLGTCCCISLIILVLHWREKLEDKKEKMQDAHRFHFDAM